MPFKFSRTFDQRATDGALGASTRHVGMIDAL